MTKVAMMCGRFVFHRLRRLFLSMTAEMIRKDAVCQRIRKIRSRGPVCSCCDQSSVDLVLQNRRMHPAQEKSSKCNTRPGHPLLYAVAAVGFTDFAGMVGPRLVLRASWRQRRASWEQVVSKNCSTSSPLPADLVLGQARTSTSTSPTLLCKKEHLPNTLRKRPVFFFFQKKKERSRAEKGGARRARPFGCVRWPRFRC